MAAQQSGSLLHLPVAGPGEEEGSATRLLARSSSLPVVAAGLDRLITQELRTPSDPETPPGYRRLSPEETKTYLVRLRRRRWLRRAVVIFLLCAGTGWLTWMAVTLVHRYVGPAPTPLTWSALDPADSTMCGTREEERTRVRRIVGGGNASYAAWPWTVSLRIQGHWCGAALLSRRWVLTASHCVEHCNEQRAGVAWCEGKSSGSLSVRLGEHHTGHQDEPDRHLDLPVRRVIMHPNFDTKRLRNDIALLEMEDEAVEYQKNIRPICLPDHDNPLTGHVGTVSGWGRTSKDRHHSEILKEVELPILDQLECMEMYMRANKTQYISPESFLCAGSSAGGEDACDGDSGGPLAVQGEGGRWQLAGIVSWGNECGVRNRPGAYTRISQFRSWIRATAVH